MMNKASVPIRFYECPFRSFEETIDPCEAALYNWLVSISPPRPAWTPQPAMQVEIAADVNQRIIDDQAACVASRYASQGSPRSGVTVSVGTQLAAGAGAVGEAESGMRASVSVGIEPPAPPAGCPAIEYHILNKIAGVGSNRYPENTKISTTATAPAMNGVGPFAGSIVQPASLQEYKWYETLHDYFTAGAWKIESSKAFSHYAAWALIDTPTPGSGLLARMTPLDLVRQNIELIDFPQMGAGGPRWRVVHRYTHQQSGRHWSYSEWITPLNSQNANWPTANGGGTWGRGYAGEFLWGAFSAIEADDGNFFDPEGTWIHQSGVIDFAADAIYGQVTYAGDLCEEFVTTFTESSIPDPYTCAFLSPLAVFEEAVAVKTIKQFKAAYRVTGIEGVDGVGVLIRVKLINDFPFAACVIARMPFGSGSAYYAAGTTWPLSNFTVVVSRNLPAKSESPEISFVLPLRHISLGTIDYTMSDVSYDAQNGDGIVQHGFACADMAYTDRLTIESITSDASAIVAANDGQRAHAWGFYNPAGDRFWSQGALIGQSAGAVVFSFTPTAAAGVYGGMSIVVQVESWVSSDNVNWTGCLHQYVSWLGYYEWVATGLPNINAVSIGLSRYGARQRYGEIITAAPGGVRSNDISSFCVDWNNGNSSELTAHLEAAFTAQVKGWIEDAIKGDTGYPYALCNMVSGSTLPASIRAFRTDVVAADDFTFSPVPADDGLWCTISGQPFHGSEYGSVKFLVSAGQTAAQFALW